MAKKILLIVGAFLLLVGVMRGQEVQKQEEGKFNASETILHHILDSHDWVIIEKPHVGLPLPWIVYSSRDGLCFYMNSEAMVKEAKFGLDHHGKLFAMKAGATPTPSETHEPAHPTETPILTEGELTKTDAHATEVHANPNEDTTVKIYDFSMTKTAFQMLLVGIAMLLVFVSIAKSYTKNKGKAPSGTQSLFEPIIVFVRDLAKEHLGKRHEAFLPYLLTLFFFIWFSNLFGLTPLNSNIAGNFTVTACLALLTFILIIVNGTKDYWMHILAMPGVPKVMLILLTPIEILSMFIKPAALAIRLFANIVAGHFMVLSLISLTFILGNLGTSPAGGFGGAAFGVIFSLAIYCLEFLVAIIQAYIFTLLSTIFIAMALESHDDHGHSHEPEKHTSEVNKDLRLSDFGTN